MITIIDSLRFAEEHAPINASFLTTINCAFPNEKINVFLQKRHKNTVIKVLTNNKQKHDNLKFHQIWGISNKKNTLSLFLSYLICTFYDSALLITQKSNRIFYTSVNPISLFFVKLLNALFPRRIYIILHGELEYLNAHSDHKLPIQTRLLRKWYRLIFWRLLTKNVKYIVLGESIMVNLRKLKEVEFPSSNFIVIDHPYFFKENATIKNDSETIIFAIVGHVAAIKGSHLIYELAERNKTSVISGKLKFKIIGHISECVNKFKNSLVITKSEKYFMPREEYEAEISSLHYILFFYPESMYKYIASGAFFDAISFEKPIIALRNSFFEYYFDKFHDIGYLCNGLDEMQTHITNFDQEKYNIQVQNIIKAKEFLSIENISNKLMSQIDI